MRRRSTVALFLLAVVLFSGCTGSVSTGGADATTTAGATTTANATSTTTIPDLGSLTLPPGIDRSGVANVSRLLAAQPHPGGETGFDLRFSTNTSNEQNRSQESVRHYRYDARSNASLLDVQGNSSDGQVAFTLYRTGGSVFHLAGGTGRQVGMSPADFRQYAAWTPILTPFIRNETFGKPTVVVRNGTPMLRLESTGFTHDVAMGPQGVTPTDLSTTKLVDQHGHIRHLVFDMTYDVSGTRTEYHQELTLTDVGSTTVDRPDWMESVTTTPTTTTTTTAGITTSPPADALSNLRHSPDSYPVVKVVEHRATRLFVVVKNTGGTPIDLSTVGFSVSSSAGTRTLQFGQILGVHQYTAPGLDGDSVLKAGGNVQVRFDLTAIYGHPLAPHETVTVSTVTDAGSDVLVTVTLGDLSGSGVTIVRKYTDGSS